MFLRSFFKYIKLLFFLLLDSVSLEFPLDLFLRSLILPLFSFTRVLAIVLYIIELTFFSYFLGEKLIL